MILMGYFYYDELLKIKDIVFDFESGYFYKISLLDKLLRKNFVNISERFNISHVI
jgi:hypothetical protein